MSTTAPSRRSRQAARVVRLDSRYAYLVFPSWCAGQVLVRIPAAVLTRATSVARPDLLHAELTAQITLGALLEEDLDPLAWQLATEPD
ncbi:hypothetical protein [Streptacidiphilus sp. EB103A]|uniref:hypothetical protein n=1 Tax=Streptacidiphilus sp. EB103A TaxID=3156275 RepID=UPI0035147F45